MQWQEKNNFFKVVESLLHAAWRSKFFITSKSFNVNVRLLCLKHEEYGKYPERRCLIGS